MDCQLIGSIIRDTVSRYVLYIYVEGNAHCCYDSGVSRRAFFSILDSCASVSTLRFRTALASSGAFFFFFTTMDVKSFTTGGVTATADAEPLSSLSNACAAKAGALPSNDSVGEVFNSSTCDHYQKQGVYIVHLDRPSTRDHRANRKAP